MLRAHDFNDAEPPIALCESIGCNRQPLKRNPHRFQQEDARELRCICEELDGRAIGCQVHHPIRRGASGTHLLDGQVG